jgi:hypothetical protein
MKTSARLHQAKSGFTVFETAIGITVAAFLGIIICEVLRASLALAAKNTAVNAAHQEARDGVTRLVRDIHASVSVPQLRDNGFAWVSSTPAPGGTAPSAAGVSFQMVASGPNYIFKDPTATNLIMIKDHPSSPPLPGMRLIVPFWGQEDVITRVTAAGTTNHSNVFTRDGIETGIKGSPSFGGSTYAITYYTNHVMYLVRNGSYLPDPQGPYTITLGTYTTGSGDRYALQENGSYAPSPTGTHTITPQAYTSGSAPRYRYENGELNYYLYRSTSTNPTVAGTLYWKHTAVVARYISSPLPFSVPVNSSGSSDNKYVQVQLSARDPQSTNRGYRATSTLLDTQIDYRSRLTLYQ